MKLTAKLLKKMIKEEMTEQGQYQDFGSNSDRIKMVNESPSVENINTENIMLVIDALTQLGYLAVPMAAAAMGVTKVLDKTGKSKEEPNKLQEDREESSLEKILKILKSAEGGLPFSDLVDKAGMPREDVVGIYQDNSELFHQIYDGGRKYKLSKQGQQALNNLLNPPTDAEIRRRELLTKAALGLEEELGELQENREENLREKISIYVAEMDENQLAEFVRVHLNPFAVANRLEDPSGLYPMPESDK